MPRKKSTLSLKVRKKLGLTQEEFAEFFGVHRITISHWERRVLKPNHYCRRLLDLFWLATTENLNIYSIYSEFGPIYTTWKILGTVFGVKKS